MMKGEFTKRDVLQSRGWVAPHAKGQYAGPIKEKSLHTFKHHWGNLPELDDAMDKTRYTGRNHKGKVTKAEVLLPNANYNANSNDFRTDSSSYQYDWETDDAMMIRTGLQHLAGSMIRSSRAADGNLDWAEELILGITKDNPDNNGPSFIPDSNSLKESAAWVNCVARGFDFGDGYIIEAFRILHYDAKTQNYICQSSTPMGRDYTAPVHDLPLFVVPAIMLTNQAEVAWTLLPSQEKYAVGVNDYTEPLGFGDYILIHAYNISTPISYPLRAVHAENGLYDLVMNGTEWRRHHCAAVGFKIDRTTLVTSTPSGISPKTMTKTTEFGYGEFLSLAIGVGRLHDVMHIASETAIPVDPDKPEWIPTHLDNRGAKRVELRTPPPSGGKSDIVRCRDCNGRVIIHIDSDYDKPSAACPHCRSKDGVQFPQLLNATIGPEDSPVGQEVE